MIPVMDNTTKRRMFFDWENNETPPATPPVSRTPSFESTNDNSLSLKSPMKIRERFKRLLKSSGSEKVKAEDEAKPSSYDPERLQGLRAALMPASKILRLDDKEAPYVLMLQDLPNLNAMNNARENHFQENVLKLIDSGGYLGYLEEVTVVPASKRDIFTDPCGLRKARQQLLEQRSQEPVDYELDEVWVCRYKDREFHLTTKSQLLLMVMNTKEMFSHTDGGFKAQMFKKHLIEVDCGEDLPSIGIRVPVEKTYAMWKFMVRFLCDDHGFDYSVKNDYLSKLSIGGLQMKPFDDANVDLTLWFALLPIKRWELHYGYIVTSAVSLILHRAWDSDSHLGYLSGLIKCRNETTQGRYVSWLDLAMQN
jgi:hypothetical protein